MRDSNQLLCEILTYVPPLEPFFFRQTNDEFAVNKPPGELRMSARQRHWRGVSGKIFGYVFCHLGSAIARLMG
ncbi:hypothetical protein Q8F57_039615 [Paraburkholderia terrae]|uniref:hypothetical protein n=1 Tax=Paraburkholderia terrae TaxID=311230 RepID=UPI00296AFA86|nr:hypothetical protein [Paraburkholderia terrae]MDW3658693.1 hypothetical protein [Paraburkholderia terrae]